MISPNMGILTHDRPRSPSQPASPDASRRIAIDPVTGNTSSKNIFAKNYSYVGRSAFHSPIVSSGKMPNESYSQMSWEIRNQSLVLENIGLTTGEGTPSISSSKPTASATPIRQFNVQEPSGSTFASGQHASNLSAMLLQRKNSLKNLDTMSDHSDELEYNDDEVLETTSLLPPASSNGTIVLQRKRHNAESASDSNAPTITPSFILDDDLEGGGIATSSTTNFTKTCTSCIWTQSREIVAILPAVLVGLMLNLLDAISYGMIMFPTFLNYLEGFSSYGISMFFISTIVSQVIFSGGLSQFKGGNGSMMIEIIPFLYTMCQTIDNYMGDAPNDAKIATIIVTYAVSSALSGVAFLLLAYFRLGTLIGFFPRHILVGCIGGVGYFLMQTGLEVTSGITIQYNLNCFESLLKPHVLALWGTSLGLALMLRILIRYIHHRLFVPSFFLITPIAFYIVIFFSGISLETLRETKWLYPLATDPEPFYKYFEYIDFAKVSWKAILKTAPAMLSLAFFAILHIPINIPALAISVCQDVNITQELAAHGVSNLVSGLVGSVQNYLVYSNSVLFMRSGGDSRIAGLMLAAGTVVLLFVGSTVVAFVPSIVVGSLIFHLGIELMKESVYDTFGQLSVLDYLTVVLIVFGMAIFGFMEGIFMGIILACFFFVVTYSHSQKVIQASLSGNSAKSSVRRLFRQQKFLNTVGSQIHILKLQGYLFFGTFRSLEKAIKGLLNEHAWKRNPIRFLILDLSLVSGVDFSAVESFSKILRQLERRKVHMILCGANANSDVGVALRRAGIWNHTQDNGVFVFETLNFAMEWCENLLLEAMYRKQPPSSNSLPPPPLAVRKSDLELVLLEHSMEATPRQVCIKDAAENAAKASNNIQNIPRPLTILKQAFFEILPDEEVLQKISSYFIEDFYASDTRLWQINDIPDYLYVVEQGQLTRSIEKNGKLVVVETILHGTMVGELGIFTKQRHASVVTVVQPSVVWKLSIEAFDQLCISEPLLVIQFMKLALTYSNQRLDNFEMNSA